MTLRNKNNCIETDSCFLLSATNLFTTWSLIIPDYLILSIFSEKYARSETLEEHKKMNDGITNKDKIMLLSIEVKEIFCLISTDISSRVMYVGRRDANVNAR